MGVEIDRLEIVADTQFQSAFNSMDKFADKLETISKSLESASGKGLATLADGIGKLSASCQSFKGVKATDINRIVKGINKFNNIDGAKITSISNAITPLAKSLNSLGGVNNDKGITRIVNSITRLNNSLSGGVDTTKIDSIGTSLSTLVGSLAGAGSIDARTSSIVSSIARLASTGDKTGATASGLPLLQEKLTSFIATLSSAPLVAENTTQITAAIARLASAGNRAADTAKNLDNLSKKLLEFIKSLTNAPQVSTSTTQLVTAIGNIASAGGRANGAFHSLTGGSTKSSHAIKRFVGSVKSMKSHLKDAKSHLNVFSKSSNNLAAKFGMFYAKFFMVVRGIKKFGEALGSAQDYIEEFNYFSVALDKIGKDSASQFKKAGYNSAEEYARSFRKRFGKLQKQMTGYTVDYDTGDATSGRSHNLGLDLTEVMNYNAAISQITNSAGMLGETSINTSKALSMLTADWSSLSNQDLKSVMDNFQSGLVGQSRALYKYGIDITSAGLAQTAMNHGIKKSISNLSQQSKMQLRVLTMLEQSKVAYGDLARTINQPANQLRMLQAGFNNLSRTIGSLFMPIVQKLYPYLNAMVMVLQEFAQWVAKLTGAKLGDTSGSVATPDYSDAVGDTDKIADNMDETSKKAKKASDNLQSFDKINKLDDNSDSDSDKDNKKNANIDLSKDISNALKNYESIWDKAFKSNKNKAVQLAGKIKKALVGGWKKGGDYTSLGKALASWMNKGMNKIPWAKIKATTKKIAKSIATFLNGFVKNLDWKLLGKNLGELLNTWTQTAYEFWTTFDWLQFGTKIKEGITSAIEAFDTKLSGKLLGAKLRGMIQFAFGLMVDFPYKKIGKKIGDYINGFLEDMGKVDDRTGLTGWQELGKTISDSIKGILDTINTALSRVKWWEVGKAIGDFLGQLDWGGILADVGRTILNALFSAIKTVISAFINDPIGVGRSIIAVLGGYFAYKKLKVLIPIIKTGIANVFQSGIVGGINSIKPNTITSKCSGIVSKIGSKLGTAMSSYMALNIEAAAISGIGQTIMDNSEEGSNAYNFGTGVHRFGEFVDKLLGLDFSGVASDLSEASDSLNAVFNPKAYADKQEAKRNGNEKSFNRNKNAIENASNYEDYLEAFGEKKANEFLSSLSGEAREDAKAVYSAWKKLDTLKNGIKGLGKEGKLALNLTQTAFDEGAISASSYNRILSKSYTSYAEFNAEFRKAKNAQKYMNGDLAKYNKLSAKMEKSLRKVGYSSKELSGVQATLNTMLQNGEISFDDYKKIVDKSYGSTKELYGTVKKIAGKKVAAQVVADVKGADDVKTLNGEIEKVNSKNVRVYAETNGINSVNTLKTAIGNMSNKQISVLISPKLRKNWAAIMQNELYKQTFSINAKTTTKGKGEGSKLSSFAKSIKNAGIKSEEGKKVNYEKLASLLSKVDTTWDEWGQIVIPGARDFNGDKTKAKAMQKSKNWKKLIEFLKKNGIKTNNPILLGSGGFPNVGQMFIAGERGPELVGNIGSRNAVVNNYQIVSSVSEGVATAAYAAVKAAVREVLSEMPIGGGDVYLDATKLTKEVMSTAKKISKSRGTAWNLA